MRIAVIGTGNVGGTLGRRWAEEGHEVVFGARNPEGDKAASLVSSIEGRVEVAGVAEAAASASVVVLATPWDAVPDAIESAGDFAGKVLVDCTNPLTFADGRLQLALGLDTSGAEQVADWAEGARVVKCFNSTGWENMANPVFGGQAATMFLCGDDPEARRTVAGLAEDLGFEAWDAGELLMSRYLEPLAMVWILRARIEGAGPDFAFKMLRR